MGNETVLPPKLTTLRGEELVRATWLSLKEGDTVYLYAFEKYDGTLRREYGVGPYTIVSKERRVIGSDTSGVAVPHDADDLYKLREFVEVRVAISYICYADNAEMIERAKSMLACDVTTLLDDEGEIAPTVTPIKDGRAHMIDEVLLEHEPGTEGEVD